MFKFLSLFKRNRDEQLNDNDYDFNEAPVSVIDGDGAVEANKPIRTDASSSQRKDAAPPPPPIDTTRQADADRTRVDEITAEINKPSGDPQPPAGEEDITATSENAETPTNILFSPDVSLFPDQGSTGEEEPEIPIGVTRFQRGDKKILDWVSVDHTGDLYDTVHRTIEEAITTHNPQIVITEGHASYSGPDTSNSILDNRQEIIDWTKEQVDKVRKGNVKAKDIKIPEAGYAAYIAQEHGIRSIGGEPTGKEFLDGMKARVNHMEPEGYPPEAVIADAFMRQVEGMELEDRVAMTEEEFETKYAPKMLAEANRRVDPLQETHTPPLTLDQFKEWYAAHPLSGNRRYINVGYDDFTPREDGSYSQVMACESGIVRDQHIAKLIADLHNQGIDRIMSVYGLNHLEYQRPVLEDMYGSPGTFTSLVNEDTGLQQAA